MAAVSSRPASVNISASRSRSSLEQQAIECADVPIERLTDEQLLAIAAGGVPDNDMMPKALPPPRKFSRG